MSNPTLISVPFANRGNKNTIQTTRQVGQDAQDATWTDGFPSITMTPTSAGGLPPKGLDFNGIFYALSDNIVHRLKGLTVQFSATYAAAIGGYPMYAKLELNNGSAIVESTVNGNMTDPNSSMTGWRVYSSYSLLNGKLDITAYQKATNIISAASGTADAITASYTPAITTLSNGMSLFVRAASANTTTTPTFTPNSGTITAKTIVKGAGSALVAGDIAGGGHWIELQYDATLDNWVLLNPAKGVASTSAATESTAGIAKIATTAQAKALTDDTTIMTPAKIPSALNASGDAPIYACRAWVKFNATSGTPIIGASGNVSSITDNGIGNYTVNCNLAMHDLNFAASALVLRSSNGFVYETARTTSSISLATKQDDASSFDCEMSVILVR